MDAEDRDEELLSIARAWMKAWQGTDPAVLNALHAETFIDHAAGDRTPDHDGFVGGIHELYAAFPDFLAKVEDIVVDAAAGSIAIRWTATGTHRGRFLGVEPTGRPIVFRGIELLHVRHNEITDRWGEWDGLDLLRQLR